MAKQTYDEALRLVLAHEGGYTNHPDDPGGPTNWGITIFDARMYWKPNATALDVKEMPIEVAKGIYKSKYWNALNCDALPAGVDYVVFDYGVNSGNGRSGKVLRRVLGLPDDDWHVTAAVLVAVAKRDPKLIVAAICDERIRFLHGLKTWPVFGKGWGRRVQESRATGIRMATATAPATTHPLPLSVPGKGAVPAPKGARDAATKGAPTAAVGAGAIFWEWVAAHPFVSVAIAALVIGGIVFAVHRIKVWHAAKQEAPMPDTPIVPELAGAVPKQG